MTVVYDKITNPAPEAAELESHTPFTMASEQISMSIYCQNPPFFVTQLP